LNDFIMEWTPFLTLVIGLGLFTASIFAVYRAADSALGATFLKGRPRLAQRIAVWLASLWAMVGISAVSVLVIVTTGQSSL
jgi:hypothetical protein